MKLLGILCILWGGLLGYQRFQGENRLPLAVGRCLLTDLEQLRYEVCGLRRPMPDILEQTMKDSPLWGRFWGELLSMLKGGENPLAACWQQAAMGLPPQIMHLVMPLGGMLSIGGEDFSQAVEELRQQLSYYIKEEQERQSMSQRLAAAVCFSGAGLLILVCL